MEDLGTHLLASLSMLTSDSFQLCLFLLIRRLCWSRPLGFRRENVWVFVAQRLVSRRLRDDGVPEMTRRDGFSFPVCGDWMLERASLGFSMSMPTGETLNRKWPAHE